MNVEDFTDAFSSRDWDTNPDGTITYAVVGLGGFARNVSLPGIDAGDYATVGAVVSGDPEKAERVASQYDATALTYEEFGAGDAVDDYDAVYVATPNRLHLDHVRTAAEQGKGVVCEKPLDATVERAEAMVDACEETSVSLMTAYRMQTDPVFRGLRDLVANGGIGEIQKCSGDFVFDVLAGTRGPDQWRLDGELAGGGALVDVGVYPLNTARFLLGADPVAVSASASATEPFGDCYDPDAPRFADEHVHFRTHFPNSVVGDFGASFTGQAGSSIELVGESGRIRVENAFVPDGDREVSIETDAGTVELSGVGAGEVREEFDYFAHCLLTETPPEPDGQDGLVDMRVMEAVYESAATDRRVAVRVE